MAMPFLKVGSGPAGVQDPERPAEVPQRPASAQIIQHIERVVKPGINSFGRPVFVATHLSEMQRYFLLRQCGPRCELIDQSLLVTDYCSAGILSRPSGQRNV